MKRINVIRFLLLSLTISFLSCAEEANFGFALITDIHLGKNLSAEEDLRKTVASINDNPQIEFVIISGDLTEEGDAASLQKAKSIFDNLKVPYYAVPGNHETKWSESGVTDFRKIFGDDRFYFEYQNFIFVGFNSGPVIRMMDGHVGIQDIIWLKEKLEQAGNEKNNIIVTHYPLQNGDVDNWYELTDLIRKYNVKAVLGGHYHKNMLTSYDGMPAFINRSNLRAKNEFGGYSIYTVTEDSICVSEQIINEPAQKWGGYSLKKQYYDKNNSGFERPDYAVNEQYPDIKERWTIKNNGAIYSSPVVYGGKIYIGDDLGKLSCFTLNEGKLLWEFQSGSRILGTPAADDNIVVFGSTDHNVYGIDAETGVLVWKFPTQKAVIGAVSIENGLAYVGGSDGHFRCINIRNGQEKWNYPDVEGYIETRPLVCEDKVFFGAWDNHMYALSKKDGSLLWKWNNGIERMHFSPAAVWCVGAQDKIFFSAPDRFLTALNAQTGKIVWRTGESMVRETIGLSADGKRIYSKTMQDSVVCYSTAGKHAERIWATNVGYGYDHAPSMLAEKDGVVFGSTKNGLIFALDAYSGKLLWVHKTGNSLINTVVPINAATCVFSSAEGHVGIITRNL